MAKRFKKVVLGIGLVVIGAAALVVLVRPAHRTSLPFLAGSPVLWQETYLTGSRERPTHNSNQFWPDSVAAWSEGKRDIPKPPIVTPMLGGGMTVRHTMFLFKGTEDQILSFVRGTSPSVEVSSGLENGIEPGYRRCELKLGLKKSLGVQWRPSDKAGHLKVLVDEIATTTQDERVEAFLRGGYFHPSHDLP